MSEKDRTKWIGLLLTVGVGVFHAELLSQQHVDLDGDDGVFLAEDVFVLDVQLGAVEGGLVDTDGVVQAEIVQDLTHDALGVLPLLGSTLVLDAGSRGIPLGEAEGAVFQHTHRIQNVLCQFQAAPELLFQLLGAEN